MAVGTVGLSPTLRPWLESGVEFLLADAPLPAPYSLCLEAEPSRRPQTARACAETADSRSMARSAPPLRQEAARRPPSVPEVSRRRPPAPPIPAAESAPPAAPAAAPMPVLPPDHWPAVWRERLAATRPAVVLWTYWTLGEDLCLRPDSARRELFRRLLGDLGHPAGTHSFWPAALPGGHGLEANGPVFWSGVDILKARALVVMGSPAVKALELPPRLRPFQQTRHNGRMVVVLRDVDFLVEETHRYDAVREFLRQALAPFART